MESVSAEGPRWRQTAGCSRTHVTVLGHKTHTFARKLLPFYSLGLQPHRQKVVGVGLGGLTTF